MINYDLKKIKAIIFDIDGVLSAETITLSAEGDPLRTVNIKDGYAIQLAMKLGLRIVILSGARVPSIRKRYEYLGIEDIFIGCAVKIKTYEDLLNPALKGKIAFADPSKSSSSYEHLINMLYAMGKGDPDKGWDYVEKLAKNLDGKLLSGSSAVYKGVADGEYAVGLTFEEGGAKYVADGAPVKLVYMKEGVISKPDGIYIIKNAKHMENAKKFIDFITSKEAQTLITQKLHRRSVRDDVAAPVGLLPKTEINSILDNEEVVNKNKKAWLDKFKDIFTSVQ